MIRKWLNLKLGKIGKWEKDREDQENTVKENWKRDEAKRRQEQENSDVAAKNAKAVELNDMENIVADIKTNKDNLKIMRSLLNDQTIHDMEEAIRDQESTSGSGGSAESW